jgi:hypothetical protein
MALGHHLSAEEVRYERAKAERATFIVSEAISDPHLMVAALDGIEAYERGRGMLWPEFLRWELSRHGEGLFGEHGPSWTLKFEPRVCPRVRDLVTTLGPDDRARFEQSLGALCTRPYIDNVSKFSVAYPPVVLSLYQDEAFRIVYRMSSSVVVDLLNIDGAPDVPSVADWDDWQQ